MDNDYTVKLSGSVDGNGNITAGSGLSFIEKVTFTGKLEDESGSGTWVGSSGCSGTFTTEKEVVIPAPSGEIAPVF